MATVTAAVSSSETMDCLAPKPPPTRGLTTRTRDWGSPRASAAIRRMWKGTWVEVTMVSRF